MGIWGSQVMARLVDQRRTYRHESYVHQLSDFSPPARWGLLDFMSVDFRLPPPSASSGPQPRPSTPSVPCRTSTARIHAKCSLPDLNRENPRQVFPATPQPRPSTPSVPCRTTTARIHAKCSLPDLAQVVHWLVSVMFLQTCLTGGVLTCLRMFVCLAQVAQWLVWSCLSKPVESFGVYFTWPTDMFISCLTDWHAQWPARWNKWLGIVGWAKVPWQKLQTKVVSTSCFEMSWWGSLEVK